MNNSKVAITGGAGFIGSHLAEELMNHGYSIIIIDDLSTGKKDNISELLDNNNVEFIEGSISDLSLLQKLFTDVKYVFHHAALVSVPHSITDPVSSHVINAGGTLNVMIAARDRDVKKVIYASSSAVYGDTLILPHREDLLPNPLSPYAISKLTGEYYCQVFEQVYNLRSVCLRYFNVFGPRQDLESQYTAVIPMFINAVSEGKPPVIFGDGEQTRDFTFVKDIVKANMLIAESEAVGVYNIATGNDITINNLANLIINAIGTNGKPVYQEARTGDILHSMADISKARSLGYEPSYGIEQGIKETIRSLTEYS